MAILEVADMKVNATDIKNSFGKYLKKCAEEVIYITKNNRIIAKLCSFDGAEEGYLAIKEGNAAYNYSGGKVSFEEFLKITSFCCPRPGLPIRKCIQIYIKCWHYGLTAKNAAFYQPLLM